MHFFSELTYLVEQTDSILQRPTESIAYGLVDDSHYNIAATFYVSAKTRIFACQDSQMIVQPYRDKFGIVDYDLVNVILKPVPLKQSDGRVKGLGIVQYYIYRGVDKNSFFTTTNAIIEQNAPDATDFICRFWENWENYITAIEQPNLIPTPENLGFDSSLDGGTFLEEIFNNQIDSIQVVEVKEGEWIGDVSPKSPEVEFNFEIIVETDHLTLDLAYAQKCKHIIDVSGLANTTPEEKFILKAEREKILNYIDPAAFFGLYYNIGIDVSTYSFDGTKDTVTKRTADIYIDILSKFHTKNRVYLDIRSEKGYSYNYYGNYGDNAENIVCRTIGTAFEYMKYDNWPILLLSAHIDTTHNESNNNLIFKLRRDDNLKPLVFVENGALLGEGDTSNFIQETALLNGIDTEWTREIRLFYPNYTNPSNPAETNLNVACYLKLQYFRQEDDSASPNTVLKTKFYWDTAFGGIHIPAFRLLSPLRYAINDKKIFLQGSNFAYVAENGFFNDSNIILFYARNSYSLRKSGNAFPEINIASTEINSIVDSPTLKKEKTVFNKWQANDGTDNIGIIELAGHTKIDSATPMEDVFFLGLTITEVNILDSLPNISDLHHKYFIFEEIPNQKDTVSNIPFKKYKIKVQGLGNSGIVTIADPAIPVYVYGSDLNTLCSKDFATSANLPIVLPDPGMLMEFPDCAHIQYDSNDDMVTVLFPEGEVNIEDDGDIFSFNYPNYPTDAGLNGELFYPVDTIDSNVLSSRNPNAKFPVIVICHGNGHRYSDYRYLSKFLAKNGFVVVSISCLIYDKYVNTFDLYSRTDLASRIPPSVFDSPFPFPPDDYYIAFADINTSYIYNNNSGTPLNANYAYKKLTVVTWTLATDSTGSEIFTVTGEYLLSWKEDEDFKIEFNDTTGTPKQLKLLIKVGSHNMHYLGRSSLVYPHLQIVRKYFEDKDCGNRIENKIGLIGHSRGGEAVVRCANDINITTLIKRFSISSPETRQPPTIWKYVPNDLYDVKAVISLAPTDFSTDKLATVSEDIPYYVLYGSMDNDVYGNPQIYGSNNRTSGFSIYDRSINNAEKAMSFVYGATHNGFITNNVDQGRLISNAIPVSYQRQTARAYMNAFMRKHLKEGEDSWNSIFYGDYIPKSIAYNKIYPQYQKMVNPPLPVSKWLVNFETWGSAPNIKLNGSSLVLNAATMNDLIKLDTHTPHDTKGIKVTFESGEVNTLSFEISSSGKDIRNYNFISFRIGHVVVSTEQYVDLSKMEINLISLGGSSKKILNKDIPSPYYREYFTKSAMNTVRMALSEFANNGVDLTEVTKLEFVFPSFTSRYSVLMDDIEFTN